MTPKKGPLTRASLLLQFFSGGGDGDDVPVGPSCANHRLQFDVGDAGRDIQPGLALHADGLQRIGIGGPPTRKLPPNADPDRRIGADAAVIAGEIAASDPGVGAFTAHWNWVCSVKPRSRPYRWTVAT